MHAEQGASDASDPRREARAIGAGGLAAAISTASALILAAANLTARNILQHGVAPGLDDRRTAWIARGLVAPVAGIATVLALLAPDMLVTLLLIGYSGVAQLVPAIAFGLFWRRATLPGVAWGVAAGTLVAILVQVSAWQPPWGLHAGFIGLTLNLAVTVAISLITSPPEASRLRRVEQLLGADEPTAS